MRRVLFFITVLSMQVSTSYGQDFVEDLIITTDSASFSLGLNSIDYRGSKYLYFIIAHPEESIHIKVLTKKTTNASAIYIKASTSIEVVDSLIKIEDGSYAGTIRFKNIFANPYSRLILSTSLNNSPVNRSIRLYPFIFPEMPLLEPSIEIYSGQEVRIPLPILNPYLIKYQSSWQQKGFMDYKLTESKSGPVLVLRAKRTGSQPLEVNIQSLKPFLDKDSLLSLDFFKINFSIRAIFSKVNFLNFNKPSYYFEPQGSKLISVMFDSNPNIRLNRTYRIEDQEKAGGRLVGELFTRAIIENQNKVVASLRTYALHRVEDGFLYMKLGDETKFFTNFNILKKPEITKLSLLRTAKDWTGSHIVYPGENIELKFEGVGLDNSKIIFSDGKYLSWIDTARVSDNVYYCKLTIPFDVKERSIPVTLNGSNTAFELLVSERELPRPLDFVTVNYGDGRKVINGDAFIKPALYDGEIGDLTIRFNDDMIDEPDRYNGIQYLEIEVRYWDKNKKLIESRVIEDIKIVPGKHSLRYEGYNRANASNPILRLNDIMVNKTHELRPWSRIEITIKHDKSKYEGLGYSQHIQIYRSHKFTVGIEVSFPAGLLAKNLSEAGIGTLSGLSVASMAQFSFYKKKQINKIHPLSVGLGFIFFNAFNSIANSGNDQGDIGIVSLMRFQPLRSESKVNFPLYAGVGYLFKSDAMFLLIGPGIQFNF